MLQRLSGAVKAVSTRRGLLLYAKSTDVLLTGWAPRLDPTSITVETVKVILSTATVEQRARPRFKQTPRHWHEMATRHYKPDVRVSLYELED